MLTKSQAEAARARCEAAKAEWNASTTAELRAIWISVSLDDFLAVLDTIDVLVRILKDSPSCRCKCPTHGFGCGLQEATCRLGSKCAQCEFLEEFEQ